MVCLTPLSRFGLAVSTSLALGLCVVAPAHAQDLSQVFGFGAPHTNDPMLRGTPEEREALASLEADKPIRARELAEKILKDHPESFLATWVLSQIFHLEEGRHPRARYLVLQAKSMLLGKYGQRPTDDAAIWWHKQILESESEILGEMEDREGQLAALDEYDALYLPKLTRDRVWPLMKLARYEEAIAAAKSLLRRDDLLERVAGYNGLMAVEDERLDRLASYNWGIQGIEAAQGRSCILYHNTAQSALTLFRFSEAEELARKAIRADFYDCPSSSYYHLANIYLNQGEFNKSVSAFKKLVRSRIAPRYRPMFDKDNKSILVEILLSLGKTNEALKLVRDIFEHPDRPGMTSVSLDDLRFGSGVQFWLALDQARQTELERASARSFWDGFDIRNEARAHRVKQWEIERTLLYLAPRDEILITNFRPFLRGVRPWTAGWLGKMVGVGLARAALEEARTLDEPQLGEAGHGYFRAVLGELQYHAGDWDDAIASGEEALKLLQPENVLLRLRTGAYIAAAMGQVGQGNSARAVALLREVLHTYPTAARQLGIRVPVAISHDNDPFTTAIAERLVDSPRLDVDVDDPAFRVTVTGNRKKVSMCLATRDGFRLGCGEKEFERPGDDEDEDVALACDAFHAGAFAPMVSLTSADINSLDGSTVRANADEVLKGILKPDATSKDEDE